MDIQLVPVSVEEKAVLANLYQLYEYDFSRYTNRDIGRDGGYAVTIDYYWEGDGRWHPYFITISNVIAGFVLVLLENMDVDPDPTHVIYDFMILQKYRRNGVGRAAVKEVISKYKANWVVAQMESNTPAMSFWRQVLGELTCGDYTEKYIPDRKKYLQQFSTK